MTRNSTRAGAVLVLQMAAILMAGCSSPEPGAKSGGRARDRSQATAVFSKASNGYVRTRNEDGSFRAESYVLRAGERTNLSESRSYEQLGIEDISQALERPLAVQKYVPSDDPDRTDLLILVYWGTTLTPDDIHPLENRATKEMQRSYDYESHGGTTNIDQALENPILPDTTKYASYPKYVQAEARQDAETDSTNAAILGYADTLVGKQPSDGPRDALIGELEQDRFYVVLLAYDNQLARATGQHRLLLEARFSLVERGNDFRKSLAPMALIAAKYFGQDSHGLIHNDLKEGHVEVGEPKALNTVP